MTQPGKADPADFNLPHGTQIPQVPKARAWLLSSWPPTGPTDVWISYGFTVKFVFCYREQNLAI